MKKTVFNTPLQASEAASRFKQDGIVFMGSLLPTDYVTKVRKNVDSILEDTVVADRLLNLHHEHDWVREFCARPEFVDVARGILQCDSVQVFSSLILAKQPRTKMVTPWHQDAAYDWPLSPIDCASLWFAIDDVTVENGAMEVSVGAHSGGKIEHVETPPLKNGEFFFSSQLQRSIPDDALADYKKEHCVMKSGECSFHHCMLPHTSPPNITDKRRCAVIVRYCRGDAKIVCTPGMPRYDFFRTYQMFPLN